MALRPVSSAAPVSANVLSNVADVSDYIQDSDGGDIGLAIDRVCRLAEETDSKISVIKLNRGNYSLSTTVNLPWPSSSSARHIKFDFQGVKITSTGPTAFQRMPTSNVQAVNRIENLVPNFDGCEVVGAEIGFDIGGTYGLRMNNCKATSCGIGFRLAFCLSAVIDNCFAGGCTDHAIMVCSGDGLWAGGSVTNSCSNVTELRHFRNYSTDYESTQIGIYASDGVVLNQCITEGLACKYDIHFDSENSTVITRFTIQDHHFECGNSDTLLRLDCQGQDVAIRGVDRGAIAARFIDFTGSTSSRFTITHWHYLTGSARTAWVAGSFVEGTRRQHNGRQYTAIAAVTASDTPGVSANWRDDGYAVAFVMDSGETSNSIIFPTNGASILLDTANWNVNGTARLPSNMMTDYFINGVYYQEHANGFYLNARNTVTIDNTDSSAVRDINILSKNDIKVTTTSPGTVDTNVNYTANGTTLNVP